MSKQRLIKLLLNIFAFRKNVYTFAAAIDMVDVAQLVRAPDCGSGGRGFKSHLPPKPGQKPGFLF